MNYLFENPERIRKQIGQKPLFLFLDYDGTLSEIAQRLERNSLSPCDQIILRRLLGSSQLKLALISGRALSSLEKATGVEGIIYGGNHGLEIRGPEIRFDYPIPLHSKQVMHELRNDLNACLAALPKVFLEDKGLTFSIQCRLMSDRDLPAVEALVRERIRPLADEGKIRLGIGKRVFEVCPAVAWNKGEAVLWLMDWARKRTGLDWFPIYIGDDISDEDAYKVLRGQGLSVNVGEAKISAAQYYLKDISEVWSFLGRLIEWRQEAPERPADAARPAKGK